MNQEIKGKRCDAVVSERRSMCFLLLFFYRNCCFLISQQILCQILNFLNLFCFRVSVCFVILDLFLIFSPAAVAALLSLCLFVCLFFFCFVFFLKRCFSPLFPFLGLHELCMYLGIYVYGYIGCV